MRAQANAVPSSFKGQSSRKSQHDRKHKAHQLLKTNSLSLQYHSEDTATPQLSDKLLVRHLLDVKNTRFLYSKRVYELLHHHLVNGFDFKKYRKTDYIDIEQEQAKKRNFLDGFMESKANYTTSKGGAESNRRHTFSLSNVHSRSDIVKHGYMGVRLINTQLNMQDEASRA